jgi:hypothetical protein
VGSTRRRIIQQWVTVDNIAAEEDGGLSFVSGEPFSEKTEPAFKAAVMASSFCAMRSRNRRKIRTFEESAAGAVAHLGHQARRHPRSTSVRSRADYATDAHQDQRSTTRSAPRSGS